MLELVGWGAVIASYFAIAICGYASLGKEAKASQSRFVAAVLGSCFSLLILSGIASQCFSLAELQTMREIGSLNEDQMLPDMPNLFSGGFLIGTTLFFTGRTVAKKTSRGTPQDSDGSNEAPGRRRLL